MKTVLTVEESTRLIEFGIDESLASSKAIIVKEAGLCGKWESEVPLFSLTDILSILPKEINGLGLEMGVDQGEWYAEYNPLRSPGSWSFAPELIDALNALLIWAIGAGHVKTNKDN